MRGTREPNHGSTRSQTRTLRSPFRSPIREHADLTLNDWIQESCLMSALSSDMEEPNTFNEAWNHQDQKIRNLCRQAIKKELNSMESKKYGQRNKRMKSNELKIGWMQIGHQSEKRCNTQSKISNSGI